MTNKKPKQPKKKLPIRNSLSKELRRYNKEETMLKHDFYRAITGYDAFFGEHQSGERTQMCIDKYEIKPEDLHKVYLCVIALKKTYQELAGRRLAQNGDEDPVWEYLKPNIEKIKQLYVNFQRNLKSSLDEILYDIVSD